MAAKTDPDATEQEGRRRRRIPAFVAVPVTLGLFFWLLAWAIERANEYGLLLQ